MSLGVALGVPRLQAALRAPQYGLELVTNGGFDADSGWTKGTNWTIGSGVATKAPGASGNLDQSKTGGQALVAGLTYELVFTITARVAGSVTPQFTGGTVVNSTSRSTAGTYTNTFVALTGNNNLRFVCAAAGDLSIDNVSLRRKFY